MKKNFLAFAAWLTAPDCPWQKSVIFILDSYIEVNFVTSCKVNPRDLDWLSTHAVGSRWHITAEHDDIHIVVRFEDDEEIG